ncbi:hypothetical protein AAG570_005740 [Ranatra chinensis]|uniref:Uncharacterized protein n=1 Tax=Ranatra chinensis TaxID=642074 RepID=A0ABD0Y0W0_9HEMI
MAIIQNGFGYELRLAERSLPLMALPDGENRKNGHYTTRSSHGQHLLSQLFKGWVEEDREDTRGLGSSSPLFDSAPTSYPASTSISLDKKPETARIGDGMVCVNNTDSVKLNLSQVKLNLSLVKLNPSKVKLNPSQVKLNPSKVKLNPSKVKLNPSKVKLNPSQVKLNLSHVKLDFLQWNNWFRFTCSLSPLKIACNHCDTFGGNDKQKTMERRIKGKKAGDAYIGISRVSSVVCLTERKCRNWFKEFRSVDFPLKDGPPSGVYDDKENSFQVTEESSKFIYI